MGGGDGGGCKCCVLMVLITAGLGVGLAYYFTDGFTSPLPGSLEEAGDKLSNSTGIDFDNFWPSLDHYFNEDPHGNVSSPEEAPTWKTKNGQVGLELLIQNALPEDWYPYFERAVSDWDDGSPDVLTLMTETVAPDVNCDADNQIDGLMKVCAGSYGDTGWRGLNTCILYGNTIVSSVAQMNEYYLEGASEQWHQYTMVCGHWDFGC